MSTEQDTWCEFVRNPQRAQAHLFLIVMNTSTRMIRTVHPMPSVPARFCHKIKKGKQSVEHRKVRLVVHGNYVDFEVLTTDYALTTRQCSFTVQGSPP
jgi:hypothetical protein